MYNTRILNKSDSIIAEECINIYSAKVKHVKNYAFDNENIGNTIEWLRKKYYECSVDDYAIAVTVENNNIIGFQIGFKIHILYNRDNLTFPYWYLSVHCHKENHFSFPGELSGQMALKLMNHFEQQKYYTFYTLVRLPKQLSKTADVDNYLDTMYQKNYPLYRYHRYVEQVCYDNESLEKVKQLYKGYYKFFPNVIHRPVVLMKYEMKNNYRELL